MAGFYRFIFLASYRIQYLVVYKGWIGIHVTALYTTDEMD